jgi:YegS/Rv2252/BmrU family lipid kinase
VGRFEDSLRDILAGQGILFRVVTTTRPGHAIELTRLHAKTSRAVVAVGGDGTVNEVACGLLASETNVPLGVLPVGSGNDFGWMLGMSSRLSTAVSQLLSARVRTIDYGIVRWRSYGGSTWRERAFFNAVGAGFDALVSARASHYKHLGGRVAYLAAILSVLRAWRGPQARVSSSSDPKERTFSLLLVCVANGRRVGGGYRLTPEAVLDDGLLDACVVHDMALLRKLRLLPKAIRGTHTHAPEAEMATVCKLHFGSSEPVPLHVDGEIVTDSLLELEARVVPHGIRVLEASHR